MQNSDGKRKAHEVSCNDVQRGARLSAAMFLDGRTYNCQLSYELGVTESSLSRWRSGGPMSVSMAIAIAQKLGVSIDWLILGKTNGMEEVDYDLSDFQEIATLFTTLSPVDKALVLNLGAELTKSDDNEPSHALEEEGLPCIA